MAATRAVAFGVLYGNYFNIYIVNERKTMNDKPLLRWRVYLTALVFLAELAHLAWEHFHGGVVSHNILNRRDLPAISNAWGALLLPALAWFLSGFVQTRIASKSDANELTAKLPMSVVVGFVGALVFGAVLAGSFANDYKTATQYLFMSLFAIAVLVPVYRAECLLGFVLGMTFTFGAVLPTGIGSVFVALSAFAHLLVYPLLMQSWAWLKRR